jgi:hypothetical protein
MDISNKSRNAKGTTTIAGKPAKAKTQMPETAWIPANQQHLGLQGLQIIRNNRVDNQQARFAHSRKNIIFSSHYNFFMREFF